MFMHLRKSTVLVAAVLLAACSHAPLSAMQLESDCGASLLKDKSGELVTGSSAVDAQVGGRPVQSKGAVRIYKTGEPVTLEYSEDRLNLETDEAGKLVLASCG